MPNPTVDFKILSRGYKVSGDVKSGYKATVPYLVLWKDAFTFVDDIFGGAASSVTIVGPIQWNMPYRFPASNLNIYAQSFVMEPCGADGSTTITNVARGLAPGEYFTHALITVDFLTPPEIQSLSQDPGNLNQLDPSNPLTMCEQSIQIATKTIQGFQGQFLYSSTGKAVPRDFGFLTTEAKLVLTFPRVPYLPWKFLQPYMNTVNLSQIFFCAKGTLLLTGMDTKISPNKGQLSQQVQLHFNYSPFGVDWNIVPLSTGGFDYVYRSGGSNDDTNRVYQYKDFSEIFKGIAFNVVSEPPGGIEF